jgi:cell division protease FtsH
VTIDLPDRSGRLAILQVHARDKRIAADVDLARVAAITQGLSGADLANVLNEAALLAARRKSERITASLIEEGVERALMGISSRGRILSDRERRVVAYHEVGHALAGSSLPGASPPRKLSIIPHGGSLGRTWHLPVEPTDKQLYSKQELLDHMAAMLGGRVAEEIVFSDPGSGASDDLSRVNRLARQMVAEFGMSETLGVITYPDDELEDGRYRPHSEEAARALEREARTLVEIAYSRSRDVLLSRRSDLDHLAEILLERETLDGGELEELLRRERPVRARAS